MIRAYLRLASLESSSDLAPVTTILPEAKIRAVVLGSRIRMMTAAKRLGSATKSAPSQMNSRVCEYSLYSALRAWRAMVLRSRRQSKFTVATIFLLTRVSHESFSTEFITVGAYWRVGVRPLP